MFYTCVTDAEAEAPLTDETFKAMVGPLEDGDACLPPQAYICKWATVYQGIQLVQGHTG